MLAGYVSAKFGMIGLTRTAALDYAEAGVRVNALAPGPILTELQRAGQQAQQQAASTLPMRRVGRPDEVAAAALWLCSQAPGHLGRGYSPVSISVFLGEYYRDPMKNARGRAGKESNERVAYKGGRCRSAHRPPSRRDGLGCQEPAD